MQDNNLKFPFWWFVIPVLLLVTYISLSQINADAMWTDEWLTYYRIGGGPLEPISFWQVIGNATLYPSWPPGYFMIFYGWTNTLGGTVFADRYFSLLIALLAIAVMYQLGKILHSKQLGLVAALLLGTAAFVNYYTHELRPYTLYIFAVILNAWLYWSLLKKPHLGRVAGWSFVASIGLSLYVHYTAVLCVLAIGLYHIIFERPESFAKSEADNSPDIKRDNWMRILRLGINGCLLYTPWVTVSFINVYNETLSERGLPFSEMLYEIAFSFTNSLILLSSICFLTLVWIKKREIRFIWFWIFTVAVLTTLVNLYANFLFQPRHVIGILPMIILLWAFALLIIAERQRELAGLLLGIWVGVGIVFSVNPQPFMEQIGKYIPVIAASANDTFLEIGQSCIGEDDFAIYSISQSEPVDSYDIPLNNYIGPLGYDYTHLSSIVADVEDPSDLMPDEFYTHTHEERLAIVTENVDTVWLFTLPDVSVNTELLEVHRLLLDAGYVDCGTFLDRSDAFGKVYSANSTACENIVSSCSGY